MNDEIKEILERVKKHYVLDEIQDNLLLNYITNLQHTEDLYNQLLRDYDELQQENERLKELDENYPIEEELSEAYRREEDYKSRIEKAVEYLKKPRGNYYRDLHYEPIKVITLINILNGKE